MVISKQSQDSRQQQTVAFKGQEHFAFIKTSFNYDGDELCDRHLVEKWQGRKHLMYVIENKSVCGKGDTVMFHCHACGCDSSPRIQFYFLHC